MLMQDLNLTKHYIGKTFEEIDTRSNVQTGYITFNWPVINLGTLHMYGS